MSEHNQTCSERCRKKKSTPSPQGNNFLQPSTCRVSVRAEIPIKLKSTSPFADSILSSSEEGVPINWRKKFEKFPPPRPLCQTENQQPAKKVNRSTTNTTNTATKPGPDMIGTAAPTLSGTLSEQGHCHAQDSIENHQKKAKMPI